ncbi:MAG TPA: hypothetical protein VFW23_10980 [Tepidisphaeraceae bacterium]|nr:hypothetical protein [Tepidisphaeraceae bacterium]
MAKIDLQPIEIDSVANEIRISVPITAPVERFYRRSRATRLIAMSVFSIACAVMGFSRFHDVAWDAMWFLFAVTFGASGIYALLYPHRVEIYMPRTSIIRLTDSSVTVTDVERGRTECFAKVDISSAKAARCAFTRCSKLVVGAKRRGRHYRSIIAMYAELPPLTRIAEILNQSLHPDAARD